MIAKDPTDEMLCLQDFDETEASFYRLERPNRPWGDYGNILIHGMGSGLARDPGPMELQRTGPYVPPITFPGVSGIVVTADLRYELEDSGLTGFTFAPVIKETIVAIDWPAWDFTSQEPEFCPEDGEPESYLLQGEHSPELARSMPDLWRLVIPRGATELRVPEGAYHPLSAGKIHVRAATWNGADFFMADTTLYHYLSPRARAWLLDRHPAWLTCIPVETR